LGLSLVVAYLSDKTGVRLPFILFGDALLIIGLAILLHGSSDFSTEYAGICLVSMGAFSAGAIVVCWYLMNLHGHVSRSIGAGWMIGFGNCGGVVAPFAFISTDAPWYHTGYSLLMAMTVLNAAAALGYGGLVWRERKLGKTTTEHGHLMSL
jgi:MFS family permease